MRIWDVKPRYLCRKHLLGEHRELHALWSIIVNGKKGYSKHPETLRWIGKLAALYGRHDELVKEMKARGYRHLSNLDRKYAKGGKVQQVYIDSVRAQKVILRDKACECFKGSSANF